MPKKKKDTPEVDENTKWIYESPDGGTTVFRRRIGDLPHLKEQVWDVTVDITRKEIKEQIGIDILQKIKHNIENGK